MPQNIFRLLSRHQQLDEALRLEQYRRWPDFVRILRLMQLKLAVKNRLNLLAIGRLRTGLRAAHPC